MEPKSPQSYKSDVAHNVRIPSFRYGDDVYANIQITIRDA